MNNTTKNTLRFALIAFFTMSLVSCNSSNEDITPKLKINAKKVNSLEDPNGPENPQPPVILNY